jgi:hypothetical protein
MIQEEDAGAIENGTRVTAFYIFKFKDFPWRPVDRQLSDGEELRLENSA